MKLMTIRFLFRQLPKEATDAPEALPPKAEYECVFKRDKFKCALVPGGIEGLTEKVLKLVRDTAEEQNCQDKIFFLDIKEIGKEFHCAAIHSTLRRTTLCIVSDMPIPQYERIEKEEVVDEGPPPVLALSTKEINPLSLLVRNMFDKRNSLQDLATKERFLKEFVDHPVENVKKQLVEAKHTLIAAMGKAVHRGEQIEDIAEKTEDLVVNAERFRIQGERLNDQGCWGIFKRMFSY